MAKQVMNYGKRIVMEALKGVSFIPHNDYLKGIDMNDGFYDIYVKGKTLTLTLSGQDKNYALTGWMREIIEQKPIYDPTGAVWIGNSYCKIKDYCNMEKIIRVKRLAYIDDGSRYSDFYDTYYPIKHISIEDMKAVLEALSPEDRDKVLIEIKTMLGL